MQSWMRQRRQSILGRWVEAIVAVYPPETVRFLRRENDRFRNPIGFSVQHGAGVLFDALLGVCGEERARAALDEIVRVRAVQDLTAAQAAGFILPLKQAIAAEPDFDAAAPGVLPLFEEIDRLALMAFEAYAQCREQLYKARATDAAGRPSPALMHLRAASDCAPEGCAACDLEGKDLRP